MDDQAMATGTKIYVEGHGEGTVAGFKKNTFGANEHSVNFTCGTILRLRLRDATWWSARLSDIAHAAQAAEQVCTHMSMYSHRVKQRTLLNSLHQLWRQHIYFFVHSVHVGTAAAGGSGRTRGGGET
jgi:hypothetical protein